MNWYDRPNYSDVWQSNVDYVMFIDENNSVDAINRVLKKIHTGEDISPNENIFTVTGCLFSPYNYKLAKENFDKLRNKFWHNGKYYNPKTKMDETVCFHSEDIRGRKKAFHKDALKEELYDSFIIELDKVLSETTYKIISISINLKDYLLKSKYTEMNVYKTAFNFIIERFIFNIGNQNKGYIIFESRGPKEDKDLLEHVDNIINRRGTEFICSNELKSKVIGVYFNPKRDTKGHPYTGLEIADLSSYPIHRFVKFNTIGRDLETLKVKIVGYPKCEGRGLKIYPKK